VQPHPNPQTLDNLLAKEKLEHDFNIEHVTAERFSSAEKFIRACEKVGVWQLKRNELTVDAGFYIGELAREVAQTIHALIKQGDVMLARRLPPVVELLQDALKVYGQKVTGRVTKHLSIAQLLKKHKARELLAMLSALHPDWHYLLLHIYHPRIRELPEDKRREIQLRKRRKIETFPEEKLRALLLSKERFVGWHAGKRTEEWRKHGMAEIIENIIAVREGENENINLFVEQLWRGWLWGGPGPTFVKCDWHGKNSLPARDDVRAWMKVVMPFLRRVTGDNAMKLGVFDHMLAARRSVFAGERLADDKQGYIWNQVENRISKAWVTMTKRARKRNSEKSA